MTRALHPRILIALIVTALLALGGAASARKGPGGPGGGPDGPRAEFNLHMLERAAGQLGIDDATLTRIKDRVYQAEKIGIDLKAKLELAKLELRRVLDGESPAKADAMKRIADVGRLETELRQHQIGLMLDVKAMLTPEQRAALSKMRRDRGERRRGKRGKQGKRGERGGPPAPPAPPGD